MHLNQSLDEGFSGLLSTLSGHPTNSYQAIDFSHALFVAGLLASQKPTDVLELGVGSGYLTQVLLSALSANMRGQLTSVDNFIDWEKSKPAHIIALQKKYPGWKLAIGDESEFLRRAPTAAYDCVVSDGDHPNGYQNAPEVFRVCRVGGAIVFHDTNSDLFRLLARLPARCRALGFPCAHFIARSRPDENTHRGMLVVWKARAKPFTLDLSTRLYLRWRDRLPESWRSRLRRSAHS